MEKNRFFEEINGNFGFGCMRLPMTGDEVDLKQFCEMTDAFIAAGFNYFDTAHGYINGKSETAIRDCVSKRYSRDKFLLTNKLSDTYFNSNEEIIPFFKSQLQLCGVTYFDFYRMHAQNRNNYKKYKEYKAYETCFELKKQGYIRHLGLSFHDTADVLDMILSEHPEIEIVQIQFNYVDYNDNAVQSAKVYEVCEKYNKPVIIMEPVKGGSLVNLPESADKILRELNGGSNASYAVRFAGSFPQVAMVLSGMSNNEQMADNISSMRDFKPLDEREFEAVTKVCDIFKKQNRIPCTGCKYCIEQNQCPCDIMIPDLFSAYNTYETFHSWNTKMYYRTNIVNGHGNPLDCIKCGGCESVCPQHLPIRDLLSDVADAFEHKRM